MTTERIKSAPTTATDLIHSPDDGGYYLKQWAFLSGKTRTSAEVYETSEQAMSEFEQRNVKWESWS